MSFLKMASKTNALKKREPFNINAMMGSVRKLKDNSSGKIGVELSTMM